MAKRKTVSRKFYGYYPDERSVIEIIKLKARTRRGGRKLGFSGIARELNEEGYSTQLGKKWRAQTVVNILDRKDSQVRRARWVKKTQLGVEDYLTTEQIAKCYDVLDDLRERMIFDTFLGSGLRASELAALQIRDLGIFDGRTEIEVKRGKGSKQRTVVIGKKLAGELAEYLKTCRKNAGRKEAVFLNNKNEPLKYHNLYYWAKKTGKKAGIFWLHPHVFRHTFATLLSNYTKNPFFVKQQLGHSSLETTEIYSKVIDNTKLQGMNVFEGVVFGGRDFDLL